MTTYSYTIDSSSVLYNGKDNALIHAGVLSATTATYSVNIPGLYVLRQAPNNSNTYLVAGSSLSSATARSLAALQAKYALTGFPITLRPVNARLSASASFYGVTGIPTVLKLQGSTVLPSLRPSKREFVPVSHSLTASKAINGLTHRRIFASKPSGAELRLTYDNLSDTDADTFFTVFTNASGSFSSVTLPPEALAGADSTVQAYLLLSGTSMRWGFAQPPVLETASPGVHTVTVSLKSRIIPSASRPSLPDMPQCGESPTATDACFPGITFNTSDSGISKILFPPPTAPTPPTLLSPVAGTQAPLLGATATSAGTTTFAGWNLVVNATSDDSFYPVNGINFVLDNFQYSTAYVGSNGYITFGDGSALYANLSVGNPALPKIMFGASDNSYQRVFTQTDATGTRIRYEGTAGVSGTVGSSDIIVEIFFCNPATGGAQLIELRVGTHNRTTGIFCIANSTTAFASSTITANSSWVFGGNSTGTSWSLTSNRYLG